MEVKILTLDNNETGVISLKEAVFGVVVREDILHRVVNWQLSNRQAGTHKTKERHEVSGTTAKAYKQKGTGRARHGSLRVSQMRGGGITFGPKVRSHGVLLPKKIRKLGLKCALSLKNAEGKLRIIKDLNIKENKASSLSKKLKSLGISSALFIDVARNEQNNNFVLASKNLPKIDILPLVGMNVYDILKRDNLILTEGAVKSIQESL